MISKTKLKLQLGSTVAVKSYFSSALGNFCTVAVGPDGKPVRLDNVHTCRESLQCYIGGQHAKIYPEPTYSKKYFGIGLVGPHKLDGVEAMAAEVEKALGKKARIVFHPVEGQDHLMVVEMNAFWRGHEARQGILTLLLRLGMVHWHGSIVKSLPHYSLAQPIAVHIGFFLDGNTMPKFEAAKLWGAGGLVNYLNGVTPHYKALEFSGNALLEQLWRKPGSRSA